MEIRTWRSEALKKAPQETLRLARGEWRVGFFAGLLFAMFFSRVVLPLIRNSALSGADFAGGIGLLLMAALGSFPLFYWSAIKRAHGRHR